MLRLPRPPARGKAARTSSTHAIDEPITVRSAYFFGARNGLRRVARGRDNEGRWKREGGRRMVLLVHGASRPTSVKELAA